MADKKISALTAASTPLAGTEVLPIVQSGATVKVSVADLTNGRAVATAGGSFTDNITQSTAAKGVNFTANTPAAGMTSQLLNWYEEGTFTPGLMFGTGTTGITYAGSTAARYVRIGKMVFVTGVVVLTNKGSSTGQAQVTGLPFNVASGADTVCTLRLDAVTFADVWNGVLFGTANKIFLYETTNAGASTDITDADFANNSSVYFNASYIAA